MSDELVLIGGSRIHQLVLGIRREHQRSRRVCSQAPVERPVGQSQQGAVLRCSFEPIGWDVREDAPLKPVLVAPVAVGGLRFFT